MNVAAPILVDQPAGVCVVRDAKSLESFCNPACAAAIWDREVPRDFMAWLTQMGPAYLPRGRGVVKTKDIAKEVRSIFDDCSVPNGPERSWLETDIFLMADTVVALFSVQHLRLRLDVVTTNACRKFHLDAIKGRLVCTYRGTGTQYGLSECGEDPKQIFTAPTGAPILLRGSLWPPAPPAGLLHRSPPIEGTGETRLVLVLDPIFDLEEAE